VFLACRFGLHLALLPTLLITFSARWFVVTPAPPAKRKSESSKSKAASN
jgi:hypothetical protein